MKLSHALACVTFFVELIGTSRADEDHQHVTSSASSTMNLGKQDDRRSLVSNEEGENIYGGTPTNGQEYPFYVLAGSESSFTCGGSLVAADMVLTAAHCESAFSGDVKVLVGPYERDSTSNGIAQLRKITSPMILHPDYDNVTFWNDIMMFKIEHVTLENLKPIALNWDNNNPSYAEQVTAIGMGDREDGELSDVLMKVTLTSVSLSECKSSWGDLDVKTQVCTSTTGGKGFCFGDSGGPLFDENQVQVGLFSYVSAKGCTNGIPGVCTRISGFKDWIQDTICKNSDTSPSYCSPGTTPTKSPTKTPTQAPNRLIPFRVTVSYDSNPDEYAWKIKDMTTKEVVANYPKNLGLEPYSKLKVHLSLPQGHKFIVIAKDGYGDGLVQGSLKILKEESHGKWKLVTHLTGKYKQMRFAFAA